MIIDEVDIFLLEHELATPRTYSTGSNTSRRICLVRIRSDGGLDGWGECPARPGIVGILEATGRRLLGSDPLDGRRNLATVSSGVDTCAASALAIALDDLRARLLGVPVHQLYGGAISTAFRVYAASAGYVEDVPVADAWQAEAARAIDQGLTAFKLRIGRFPVRTEAAAARVLRSAFPDLDLMADANEAYTLPLALAMGHVLAELEFGWLEEPLPTRGYRGYAELTAQSAIAVAGGEALERWADAVALSSSRLFDVVQPDVTICGGIGNALRIAELAQLGGIEVVPHSCNGAIGMAATMQLLSVLESASGSPAAQTPLLEMDFSENPHLRDLLDGAIAITDGWAQLPLGSGLGVEVDERYVYDRSVEIRTASGRKAGR